MRKLKVSLKNCYGIQSLDYEFDFGNGRAGNKAYAIYAPNGLMKTSFTRTFDSLAKGESPREERYNRLASCAIDADDSAITSDAIYVLRSEIDIGEDSPAITDILVNPQNKARYDSILVDLDKQKSILISALQKLSKVKKSEIEQVLLKDWEEKTFATCISRVKGLSIDADLSPYDYGVIFDPKSIEVLKSPEFISKANEFNTRYQELFNQDGTIYQKGVFNPAKAEASFSTLNKQGFFAGGHRVHLRGESASIDKAELEKKMQLIHSRIDGDDSLKKLRTSLAKNAQTQALTDLIENLTTSEVEYLLEKLKPENQGGFRKELWIHYIQKSPEAPIYADLYTQTKEEIEQIEKEAAIDAPRWTQAVALFNDRFVDMPFTLSVENQTQAVLGKEKAKLKFTFKDRSDIVEWSRSEVKTLSQGEKRALYLLNFIFEVEARTLANKKTIFIIDDVADSFDYKNKHAIVQYLEDLDGRPNCYQIILTHNFDFFRTLANNFVHRDRCLMANRENNGITLAKAEGIKNYFIGVWKEKVHIDECVLCATIPFTRNLIEYIRGDNDPDYIKITSLLHWKSSTDDISVGDYFEVYNDLFGTDHNADDPRIVKDLIFAKADEVCARVKHDGLNLEDKVLLSIAIRMKAEEFLIKELRNLLNNQDYWCESHNEGVLNFV